MEGFVKKTELRLIINENDSFRGESLCRLIVEQAYKLKIAGATVLKTKGGYGSRHRIHTMQVLRLSAEMPVVISMIDDHEKLIPIIEYIKERNKGGLLSLQDILVSEKQND